MFLAVATGGTFLTFDAAQPWVYHEAYLWAVRVLVGGIYWLIAAAGGPEPARCAGGCSCFAPAQRRHPGDRGLVRCLLVRSGSACSAFRPDGGSQGAVVAGLLAGAGPAVGLDRLQRVQVRHASTCSRCRTRSGPRSTQHRRDALAANGGGLTGPQFFTTSFMAYLRPDGIRFVDYFPFVTLPAHPAPAYDGARHRPELPHRQRHVLHARC